MRTFQRVCVYCGSSQTVAPAYRAAAAEVGTTLARRGIGIVYGGGAVGLMGALADAALQAGGEVIGVIPDKLMALEVGHGGLTNLYVVDSMHARKMMMAQLSDAFIGLPGGIGTLEEIFEVTTWTLLNYHRKPVGLLNFGGYYDHLLAFLGHAGAESFIRPAHRGHPLAANDIDTLLEALATVEIPDLGRWIDKP